VTGKHKQRPSIAGAALDAESGTEGDDSADKDLFALKVMRDRGLISAEEFERRRSLLNRDSSS
jgi:hypothetical protein